MSLTDPQSITVSGTAVSLPRTNTSGDGSTYTSGDGAISLRFSSQYGKRTRRTARLDFSKISADPFLPSQNVKLGASVYTVFDMPVAGFTNADVVAYWVGYRTLLAASSDAIVGKLLGGES